MRTVEDFEDLLELFGEHRVQYLIIGGLAFIFHAKPRYTKAIDLWVGPAPENLARANRALAEFGSPTLLTPGDPDQILQIGAAPNRIDLLLHVPGLDFEKTWQKRIVSPYGRAEAYWIDLESLIAIKQGIPDPPHQEDARVLRQVRDLRKSKG